MELISITYNVSLFQRSLDNSHGKGHFFSDRMTFVGEPSNRDVAQSEQLPEPPISLLPTTRPNTSGNKHS